MDYLCWPAKEPTIPEGCLVASDLTQEWILPWWWENYSQHNNFPVTFVDLGLSPEMKNWCQEKGHYVHLPLSCVFETERCSLSQEHVQHWEEKHGRLIWDNRKAWFKKPLACLQSPYKKTIWLDLDCQVTGSISPLFSSTLDASGVKVLQETINDCESGVNSGVIIFTWGVSLIEDWAKESVNTTDIYVGDQDVLYALIKKQKLSIADLSPLYNWSRFRGPNPAASILHWHGRQGKQVIEHQIFKKNMETLGFT